ncbi:MAG: hypothetical protein DCC67_03330 [Planctomycetota bacterium]|nr:MAG: hypothetical protein DCC67_03330 [Planctomycetota bacterium]
MDEPLSQLERQLAAAATHQAPPELRTAVLASVSRELRASRWDRRLARTAAVLMTAGIALNAAMVVGPHDRPPAAERQPSHASLVQAAVTVGRATDEETGRQIARQLAAWGGHPLSHEQLAALDAAIAAELHNGKDG